MSLALTLHFGGDWLRYNDGSGRLGHRRRGPERDHSRGFVARQSRGGGWRRARRRRGPRHPLNTCAQCWVVTDCPKATPSLCRKLAISGAVPLHRDSRAFRPILLTCGHCVCQICRPREKIFRLALRK